MGRYGDVALRATALLRSRACRDPEEGWTVAAREVFPRSLASQRKGCPKGAYLGLCEEGLVIGVPRGTYTQSRDNKKYAVEAVRILLRDPELADEGAMKLWTRVLHGDFKQPNSQMDVVLALWTHGLIVGAPADVPAV